MSGEATLYLVQVDTGEEYGPLEGSKGDVVFPEKVRGWSDVLDCRHTPYIDMPIKEVLHYANHVNKFYILVAEDFLRSHTSSPATLDMEDLEQA